MSRNVMQDVFIHCVAVILSETEIQSEGLGSEGIVVISWRQDYTLHPYT